MKTEPKLKDVKRQNFDVDADQAATLEAVRLSLHAQSTKDAVLTAARLVKLLASMLGAGDQLFVRKQSGDLERIIIAELERPQTDWKYLTSRPHPWRSQLYVKGRRLLASTVWGDMIANDLSHSEVAEDRDLPLEAVSEIIAYCENNRDLIAMEADEEKQRLLANGIELDVAVAR